MATDQDPGIPTELEQLRQEVARLRDEAAIRARELGACRTALAERDAWLAEAHAQQTATAEVLQVIASSSRDVQPVLDAVVDAVCRLCAADNVVLWRINGDEIGALAWRGQIGQAMAEAIAAGTESNLTVSTPSVTSRTWRKQRQVHVENLAILDDEYPTAAVSARRYGYRTMVATPLVLGGQTIGVIAVYRTEVRPFTDQQMALLRTFSGPGGDCDREYPPLRGAARQQLPGYECA